MSAPGAPTTTASLRPVLFLSFAGFCTMATMRVADPLLPEVATDFSTTAGHASIITTSFALAYGLFQVVFGPLGDRWGKYRVITLALGVAAIIVAATATSQSLATLANLRFAAGAVTAAVIPLSIAYIGDITPYEQRQPVLARYMTGTVLGLLFGQVAGGVIMEYAGWRAVFLALAVAYVLVTLCLLFELRSNRVAHHVAPASIHPMRVIVRYRDVIRAAHPRRVLIAVFLEGAMLYGGIAYLGAYLRATFALDYDVIGLLLAGFGVGGLIYTLFSRPIIRRLGEHGMVRTGAVCILIGYLSMAMLTDWRLFIVPNLLMGFGFFLFHNTLQTNATQMA
ncbi:MAG: MFS transporter, partial [Pseudomonadota bacterium]